MQIRHEMREGHLLVTAEGPFEPATARRGLGEILSAAQAAGVERILLDGRGITTLVSIADRYELATQLAAVAAGKMRIAIVVQTDNMFSKTMEDTARNRGVALVTTDSMDAALAFLGLQEP